MLWLLPGKTPGGRNSHHYAVVMLNRSLFFVNCFNTVHKIDNNFLFSWFRFWYWIGGFVTRNYSYNQNQKEIARYTSDHNVFLLSSKVVRKEKRSAQHDNRIMMWIIKQFFSMRSGKMKRYSVFWSLTIASVSPFPREYLKNLESSCSLNNSIFKSHRINGIACFGFFKNIFFDLLKYQQWEMKI